MADKEDEPIREFGESIQKDVDAINEAIGEDHPELFADLSSMLTRFITFEEVDNLLRRMAFLEICDASPDAPDPLAIPEIVTSNVDWNIHDSGSVLIASPGRLSLGSYQDEDEEGGGVMAALGTIQAQTIAVAVELITLAQGKWPDGMRIVDGYEAMQFAAYVTAIDRAYPVEGFTVSDDITKKYRHLRIQRGDTDLEIVPEEVTKPG